MSITLTIPDELATRLRPFEEQLPKILELGLREFNATAQSGFEGAAEVLEILAGLPAPEEVLALHPSEALEKQIRQLLEKNRTEGLTPAEEQAWEQYQYLEHLIRVAKGKAYLKLKAS